MVPYWVLLCNVLKTFTLTCSFNIDNNKYKAFCLYVLVHAIKVTYEILYLTAVYVIAWMNVTKLYESFSHEILHKIKSK